MPYLRTYFSVLYKYIRSQNILYYVFGLDSMYSGLYIPKRVYMLSRESVSTNSNMTKSTLHRQPDYSCNHT